MQKDINSFLNDLSSSLPTPGGGGASALCGAIGAALGSMVCNLTIGKPKYAEFDADLRQIISQLEQLRQELILLAEEDEQAFAPLSKAYSLPSSTEEEKIHKAEVMEECLQLAASVPMKIVHASYRAIELLSQLTEKGSRLAISDVGVGAAICGSALKSAALNVYINTKLMKNTEYAARLNAETDTFLEKGTALADQTYLAVEAMLKQ